MRETRDHHEDSKEFPQGFLRPLLVWLELYGSAVWVRIRRCCQPAPKVPSRQREWLGLRGLPRQMAPPIAASPALRDSPRALQAAKRCFGVSRGVRACAALTFPRSPVGCPERRRTLGGHCSATHRPERTYRGTLDSQSNAVGVGGPRLLPLRSAPQSRREGR
jgi:hypothetical protein